MRWPIIKLGEIAEVITKGTTPTSIGHKFQEQGINFIKVESITEGGEFILSKVAHISEECHSQLKRSQLKDGDILFSIAGALGRTAIVNSGILPANTNQALAIIRLNSSPDYSTEFIYKALSTGFVLEQIEKFKGGVAQQNLSLTQVKDFDIPLPPIDMQQHIVSTLDQVFNGIAEAKVIAERKLNALDELKRSMIHKVFAG